MTPEPPSAGDPRITSTETRGSSAAVQTGVSIGPYRLLHRLGEGGMGEVWLAEQSQPVRRQVAVKVVKAGMDTAQVLARFAAERQALALMDHPAIARIFDGGSTPEGRPYFAMEYVRGEAIHRYCDTNRLSIHERLELFIQLCDGVQHAHQKGVIHRDLKPSNVLVSSADRTPAVHIIDFGIAKAMSQPLTDQPLYTAIGGFVGTLEYMSPEQAEGSSIDVDTRSDVYSLGVLLYQLLTDLLPFDVEKLREAGIDEFRRTVRDRDPLKPSTRIGDPRSDSTVTAERRRTQPSKLIGLLRGDLDWITMKALERDRTRRYQTVNAMALDVRRHLNHEPVLAGPPSASYRARKFVRRHRVGVSAAATLVVLLVAFAMTMAEQARRIAGERDRANQESSRANREAEAARQVSDFLIKLFALSDPSEARGSAVTAREILDTGSARIERELATQPELRSQLMGTMGKAYQSLGLYAPSESLFRTSLDTRRTTPGVPAGLLAESLHNLGFALVLRGDYASAESLLNEALALRERLGDDHAVDLAETLGALGVLAYSRGEYSRAVAYNQRRLDNLRRLPSGREIEISDALNDLSMSVQQAQADYVTAKQLASEALALRRTALQAPHLAISQGLNNLAMVHYRLKEYDAAEPLFNESLAMNRQLFGEHHPEVTANLSNLGLLARDRGDYLEADRLFAQVVAADRKVLGPGHVQVGRALNNWAESVRRSGDAARAAELLRESIAIHASALAPNHWQTAITRSMLARCLVDLHRFADAERLLIDAYAVVEKEFGVTHVRVQAVVERGVELYDAWKRPEQAALWRQRLFRPSP